MAALYNLPSAGPWQDMAQLLSSGPADIELLDKLSSRLDEIEQRLSDIEDKLIVMDIQRQKDNTV